MRSNRAIKTSLGIWSGVYVLFDVYKHLFRSFNQKAIQAVWLPKLKWKKNETALCLALLEDLLLASAVLWELPLFWWSFAFWFLPKVFFDLCVKKKTHNEFNVSVQEWTPTGSKSQINIGLGCETRCKKNFFDLDPLASLQFFHLDLQMEPLR